jgi:hypothetical protein
MPQSFFFIILFKIYQNKFFSKRVKKFFKNFFFKNFQFFFQKTLKFNKNFQNSLKNIDENYERIF